MVDARTYHERTNHTVERLRSTSHTLDERTRPRPFKAYEDCPTRQLGSIRPPQQPALAAIATDRPNPRSADADAPSAIDRTTVATIAYIAAGITQETRYKDETTQFRAASCTGNLHHIDAYLVCGNLDGLGAGVYHVDPRSFSLDILRRGDHRRVIVDAAGGHREDAPLWIVFTSTWWRNAWKYRERTYRHAFWDGGTVIANALAAVHALDRRGEVITAVADEPLAGLVGVDPADEAPIAAMAIGEDCSASGPSTVESIDPTEAPLSPDQTDYPLIHEAWAQSTIPSGDAAAAWRETVQQAGAIGRVDGASGHRVDLEPVDHQTATARPLLETVRRRGSKRTFASTGPSRRQLATVLDRATRGVPADWTEGPANGLRYLDCYVLVTDVEGVPDGRYQYHPATDELERLGDTASETQRRLALNQDWAGEAHVNVYLMADVDAVVEALGNRGYRLAQLEAGITLGRLYLATAAHRTLGGTGLTFFDEAVSDHLSPRAGDQLPMTLFALGTVDTEADSPV